MADRRLTIPDKRKMRNLKQYKEMTDEDFDELYAKKTLGIEPAKEFEGRIERKLNSFEEDYDLSDMKINDRELLRALAQALITLEDLEQYTYKLRGEGISFDNLTLLKEIGKQMSDLRGDISKMQDDLKITRKIRKGDKEASVISYLEDLKKKAREFYESKMSYVFCPKCNMLLFTGWFLYPENKRNTVHLVCNRTLENGEKCGTVVTVNSKELLDNRGANVQGVPESLR